MAAASSGPKNPQGIAHPVRSALFRFAHWSGKGADFMSALAIVVLFLGLGFFTFLLISLSACQIASLSSQAPPAVFQRFAQAFVLVLGVDIRSIPAAQAGSLFAPLQNAILVIVSTWFALLPVLVLAKWRMRARRREVVRAMPVRDGNGDDLEIMRRYYKGAEEIIVFSGDFSWITESDPLQAEIRRLAKSEKIKLISYKTAAQVESAMGNPPLFGELKACFAFQSPARVKCSLVSYTGGRVFLYRLSQPGVEGGEPKVCVLREAENTRPLLEALRVLCQPA